MDIRIDGQHALVLGASQGIGRAVAHELAALGASITAVARDQQRLEALLAELPSARAPHRAIAIDVSDTGDLAKKMAAVSLEAPVDIIINNSGGPAPGPAHEADASAFEAAFRQHLIAYQTVAQAIVPSMKERGHGRIANIISTSVKQPLHNLGVSNTIRGAVANWAKTMATELGPFGITVNNVLPGATETERLTAIIRNKATKQGISEAAATAEMLAEIPLRRFAKPEEVAFAVAFLVGPAGASVNGINLPVDGGRTACL